MIAVEVWSDVACPWCYIGKRRLEQALEAFAERDQVELTWRSFQLDPDSPRFGEPGAGGTTLEHLARKYGGGIEGARKMMERVSETAAGDGLDYDLEHAARVNTHDAHRLIKAAAEHDADDAAVESLFRAQHVEARRIDDPEVLTAIATDAGIPASAAEEALADDVIAAAVESDMARATSSGCRAFPSSSSIVATGSAGRSRRSCSPMRCARRGRRARLASSGSTRHDLGLSAAGEPSIPDLRSGGRRRFYVQCAESSSGC